MTENTFEYNDKEADFDEISAAPDDLISNFTIIPNALIRDNTLSPECRWLIIYLLSNKPGWKIKTKQLAAHLKGQMGRDRLRKILKEAIASGYMMRKVILRDTGRGKLRGFCYLISSTPKFKESLRQTDIQGPDNQGPVDTATKEDYSKEDYPKESNTSLMVPEEPVATAPEGEVVNPSEEKIPDKPKRTRTPAAFSPKVKEVADRLINILMEKNPVYRPPHDLTKFLTHVQHLVEKDKQDVDILIKTFEWAASDNEERSGFKGWQGVICSTNPAETFRKHFAKIHSQMCSQPKRRFAPCGDRAESLKKWEEASKDAI